MSSPPTKFQRQFNFTDFSTEHPGDQQPGIEIDGELDAVKVASDKTIDRLGQIQRDDGALANQIVTPDALAPQTRALLGSASGTPRGAWVTTTVYAMKDLVTDDGSTYIAVLGHTAGIFATDLAAGKWMVFSAGADSTAIADAVAAAEAASADAATALGVAQAGQRWCIATGTGDAILGAFNPVVVDLATDGIEVSVRALLANTSTAPTFKADANTARVVTRLGGAALVANDIPGPNYEMKLRWKLATLHWELLNPALPYGASSGTGALMRSTAVDDKITAIGLKSGATTKITIQNGGSPPAGADGDLCFIW